MTDFIAASDKFVAAYNAKDFDQLRAAMSPNIQMAHFNRGFSVDNADDLMAAIQAVSGGLLPDSRFEVPERIKTLGNMVIREAYWGGTPIDDIPGFGAKGEPLRIKLCSVMRFDDDGILVEWKDYG